MGEAVLQPPPLKGFSLQVLGRERWVLCQAPLHSSAHNGEPSPDSPCFLQQLTSAAVMKWAAHGCSAFHLPTLRSGCANIGRLSWDTCGAGAVIIRSLFRFTPLAHFMPSDYEFGLSDCSRREWAWGDDRWDAPLDKIAGRGPCLTVKWVNWGVLIEGFKCCFWALSVKLDNEQGLKSRHNLSVNHNTLCYI